MNETTCINSSALFVPNDSHPPTTRTTKDVVAIEEWLARESAANPGFVAPQTESLGARLWQLRGALPADNWAIEVEYRVREPEAIMVRLTATEPGHIQDEIRSVGSVFLDHGLQPLCTQQTVVGIAEDPVTFLARMATLTPAELAALPAPTGSKLMTRWGAQQVLATNCLPTGLLRGVIARLLGAMQAASTKRSRAA